MAKRNIMIGVTTFEFENMPKLFIGKYTLGVEGVGDLFREMSKEWEDEHKKYTKDINAAIPSKCNVQIAIASGMPCKCVSLEALSILMRVGRKPVLRSLAMESGIPHVIHQVNNKVLFRYTLLIFDTLESALAMAKFFVDTANKKSSIRDRCSYEAVGLM
ncbi:hypothetical protein [Desulfosporosinus meridiei]|uniref:Uncharacterized protein n=1 Tax=Desulfosporosinus meridiei (strain ATCC BAA-275 / DSM 13257 / KCTC 12902 / NCIMB 13706 / S10) TaxID=768704 RepID=J7IXL1_DESMD|nr:hypothetical protein [Desulfosporosinus meridiei]AFQ44879.1 hypothetical protein Desmer_2991 [Desulfosporosinus meridiei DSM 13257]